MSRQELLEAIRKNPVEDTPRLMYADYLDEIGTTDLDRATVEFIRLSCDLKSGGRKRSDMMPRSVYQWLPANKYRLIPSVVALSLTPEEKPRGSLGGYVRGRYFHSYIRVADHGRKNLQRLFALTLEFHRGFVVDVTYCCGTLWKEIRSALVADQPLCERPGNIYHGD